MKPREPSDATVLVVDDDQRVREIAVMTLEAEGYKILEANNGQTALQLIGGNPDIDLVFSDVIMPGAMSGVDLVKEILRLRPGLKVILVTGYRDKAAALKEGLAYSSSVGLVIKPYDVDA
ncbi:MAG: response regulator, partial [Pseudohongiellaceae bacterium]